MKNLILPAAVIAMTAVPAVYAQSDSTAVVLRDVEVVANRADQKTPVAYNNVSKSELERYNDGRDITYLLNFTPSLITTSDAGSGIGYTSLRVRGTDASRINITANGIPVNDSESHNVYWVNMPDFASSLRDVQIQRGVGTSVNGAAAFGASINMITDAPSEDPYAELSGAYGSYNTNRETLRVGSGLLGDHWSFDARLSHLGSDGYIDRATSKLWSYFGQAAYRNRGTLLRFIAFGGKEETYMAWEYPSLKDIEKYGRRYNPSGEYTDKDGKTAYYADQKDNFIQHHFQLHLSQMLGEYWRMSAALHYTDDYGYYNQYKTRRTLVEYGLSDYVNDKGETVDKSDLVRLKYNDNGFGGGVVNFNYQQGHWNATFGGGAHYFHGHHFGRIAWVRNYVGPIDPLQEYYNNTGKKFDSNIFGRATYDINSKFSVFADLQYRHIHYTISGCSDNYDWNIGDMAVLDVRRDWNFFNPKAGLTWHSGRHTAYASFATGHREPTRNNYTESADEHPTFETLLDYEAGYSCNTDRWNTSVSLYYMDYRDQLVQTGRISEIGEALTSNVDDSYRIGIEVSAGVRIAGWLRWDGNVALSRNRIRNFTESVAAYDASYNDLAPIEVHYSGTDIAFSPAVCANSTFAAAAGGFEARLSTACVGRQYLDNSSCRSRSIDPYCVSNLIVGYSFRPSFISEIGLSCRITNIFDAEYETSGWVASYVVEGRSTVDNRTVEDGLAAQAGTAAMVSLTLKF